MTLYRLLAAFVLSLVSIPAAAQTIAQAAPTAQVVASATSPSGTLKVDVTLNPEGRIGYAVSREGKPVIAESRLGFLFTDAPEMLRNFALAGQATRSFDETWQQPWGEYRSIRNRYNELTVSFDEKNWDKRRMTVVFRLYDDGVGFRYEIPRHEKLPHANIADELTEFNVAEAGEAWWDPAFEWNREEYIYNRTPIEQIGTAQTPLTIRTNSGLHLSFHEAALVDYSAMNLRRVGGRTLKAVLTPSAMGPKVSRRTPVATPWRVIMIAPDAPSLYRSAQIILNLNEPNKLGDVSWSRFPATSRWMASSPSSSDRQQSRLLRDCKETDRRMQVGSRGGMNDQLSSLTGHSCSLRHSKHRRSLSHGVYLSNDAAWHRERPDVSTPHPVMVGAPHRFLRCRYTHRAGLGPMWHTHNPSVSQSLDRAASATGCGACQRRVVG